MRAAHCYISRLSENRSGPCWRFSGTDALRWTWADRVLARMLDPSTDTDSSAAIKSAEQCCTIPWSSSLLLIMSKRKQSAADSDSDDSSEVVCPEYSVSFDQPLTTNSRTWSTSILISSILTPKLTFWRLNVSSDNSFTLMLSWFTPMISPILCCPSRRSVRPWRQMVWRAIPTQS